MNPVSPQENVSIQFQSIFEAIPNPALVIRPDSPVFTILAANNAYATAHHTDPSTLIGKPFFEAFPGHASLKGTDGEPRLAASFAHVLAHGQLHTIPSLKYEVTIPNGAQAGMHYWNLKNAPVFHKNGPVQYIIHTATDITESVAQDELSIYPLRQIPEHDQVADNINKDASASYLQAVIDISQTGIFLFSPELDDNGDLIDFRFRIANRTLSAYVGLEPEAIIGELGSKWFPSFKTNGLFDFYGETYLTGKNNRFEFHYNTDGIDAWLDIMATKINDDVLVTFSDFTPLKHMQQQMEESLAELQKSNNNLEQFAYVASHDLQEPLRKIKSFGDILVARYKDNLGQDGADMINRMQLAADRMKGLIEDLLSFSRISFQQNAVAEVNLNEVIRDVLTDLEPSIKEKNAAIAVGELKPLIGDQLQMQQVFQNLLSNALKFSKKDVPAQISINAAIVSGDQLKEFSVSTADRKKQWQLITVTDQGIGFEQQYADRIFQIFQRLHGRMEYPGTGVGLSIVQKVIEHHKGYIRANGEVGTGATFSLLLPLA